VGNMTEAVFSIENAGAVALELPGSPKVALGGTDAAQFSVTVQPSSPVSPSGSTSFAVRFSPTSAGTKSAVVSIESNDDDGDPYSFTVSGTASLTPEPEIELKQGGVNIECSMLRDIQNVLRNDFAVGSDKK